MQLFFDRFGGWITILLAVLLAVSTTMWIVTESGLDKRIDTLEGCCDEVQQYMESSGKIDETKIQAYVDQRLEEILRQQSETTAQQIESNVASQVKAAKEEISKEISEKISTEISTKVTEEVKLQAESSNVQKSQSTAKKKRSTSASSQSASEAVSSQTSTNVVTITTAESYKESNASDPDDKHFRVGSADEDDEED